MTKHRLAVAILTALTALFASSGVASAAPQWRFDPLSNSIASPGGMHTYNIGVSNLGDESMNGSEYTLRFELPEGMQVSQLVPSSNFTPVDCTGDGPDLDPHVLTGATTLVCVGNNPIEWHDSGDGTFQLTVTVDPLASGILTPIYKVWGGGATTPNGGICKNPITDPPCVVGGDSTVVTPDPVSFDVDNFDNQIIDQGESPFKQAGGHPYAISTWVDFTTKSNKNSWVSQNIGEENGFPVEPIRDVLVDLPPGFLGNPTAVGRCTADELMNSEANQPDNPICPPDSQVGTMLLRVNFLGERVFVSPAPLYNMVPPTGVPARFAFKVAGVPVVLDVQVRADSDYRLTVGSRNISEVLAVSGFQVVFWGVPRDPSHDFQRSCPNQTPPRGGGERCELAGSLPPFLRMPTSCPGSGKGQPWDVHLDSWDHPGAKAHPGVIDFNGIPVLSDPNWKSRSMESHDLPGYPFASEDPATSWGATAGTTGCEFVPVKGTIDAQPTTQSAETATGLTVRVTVPNPGLDNHNGIASSDIKKVRVALPEGVTINPAQGEGLGVCTPAQYASEDLNSTQGTGCPSTSKIGTVSVKTPLLLETLEGSVYVAQSDNPVTKASGVENPFDSLVALYIVIKNPERGVIIKLAGKVEPDERTAQLITTFDEIPQLPFDSFDLKFREGVRSPLATPRTCGTYTTEAEFTPWSNPSASITSTSSFEITHGVGGGPCPSGGAGPFDPKLSGGTLNNNALSFSPFTLRMIREDGEQEITNFSADLPAGLAAKLAGIPKCSEKDLKATAEALGQSAISAPICPLASQVGRVTAGYGVGSAQTYATGRVFLAGPYRGTPISIATVVPAVVGPYDLGTVVQRSAFRVDPETAEVHVDSKASDPIPHILKGLELHLRDIRVYMDRPDFTINPTSCDRLKVGAFLNGSGADFFSPADDPTVDVSNPFQAANCSLLPFKPKLAFRLKGGTRRGDHPALRATLKARPGDANLGKAVVALPRSEFLDQAHIGTVCTRVQFAANECPPASIYGNATATTPLLDGSLSGPVYLRSSNNQLPDLVIALRGEIAVNAVGKIDSVNGGIRSTFETIPDTPIDQFTLRMQGGKKGLFVNSRNLCFKPARAQVRFTGQNGKVRQLQPKMQVSCKKGRKGHRPRR